MTNAPYTAQVLAAYEAEIAGATYFDALASLYPGHAQLFGRFAALERTTAGQLEALIGKYALVPQERAILEARGEVEARMESGRDWAELMRHSIGAYAAYVAAFRALEALGPAEDRAVLAALTAHEVQLIEWMRAALAS